MARIPRQGRVYEEVTPGLTWRKKLQNCKKCPKKIMDGGRDATSIQAEMPPRLS